MEDPQRLVRDAVGPGRDAKEAETMPRSNGLMTKRFRIHFVAIFPTATS